MTNNPHISSQSKAGRQEWNDRYFNMAKAIKNWQLFCLYLIVAVVLLSGVIAKLATASRVQPFMVETNNGMPYAVKALTSEDKEVLQNTKVINFMANQFIINARTVLSDSQAEKILLDKVYAFVGDDALKYLHDYYQVNNPLLNGQKYTVDVNIINSMPLGKNTWQVVWDETKRSADTDSNTKTRWMAELTYRLGQVNSTFMNENPFGLYITHISWSESVGQ